MATNIDSDLIGKIATCSKGIVGEIQGKKNLEWGESWVGIRLDDGGQWSSKHPKVIANSLQEYNDQLLAEFESGFSKFVVEEFDEEID